MLLDLQLIILSRGQCPLEHCRVKGIVHPFFYFILFHLPLKWYVGLLRWYHPEISGRTLCKTLFRLYWQILPSSVK